MAAREGARVLFVCTGNQCRSPMAEAMLRARLGAASPAEADRIEVASAGFAPDGVPAAEPAVRAVADIGLDLSAHSSRHLEPEDLRAADLVVTMTRQHLLDVATMCPEALDRSFTFADLLDRAGRAGPRIPGESVSTWARRLSGGRTVATVLALPGRDDIPDPMGGTAHDFEACRDHLERSVDALAGHLLPGAAPPPAGRPRRWRRKS